MSRSAKFWLILFTIPRWSPAWSTSIMLDGKKGVAQKIVYDAFDIVIRKRPATILSRLFEKAMENIMPSLECKTRRVGGANYQVPLEVSPARRETLGLRWLTAYSRARGEKTMSCSSGC